MSTFRTLLMASVPAPTPNYGRWKFDEPTGSIALDSVGSNNGTLNNSPTRITGGNSNGALSFVGGNDTVTWGAGVGNQTTGSFTVSCWLNYTGTTNAFPITFGTFGQTGAAGPGWGFLVHSDQRTYFDVRDFNNFEVASYGPALPIINDGNWHMVTGVFDRGNNIITGYVDGVAYVTASIVGLASISTTQTMIINRNLGGPTAYHGGVDDCIVHNGVWSAAQIKALYQKKAQ